MKIVFMGTAEFACPCLEAIARMSGHEVSLVVTQPDRPKGRKLKPVPPPVKTTAAQLGLELFQPEKVRDPSSIAILAAHQPDLVVIVAYGQLLPAAVLELPSRGCVNVHASLLPRWRGAAPIQYAIWNGDRETGITTMYINEQLDAGDMILQGSEPIHPDDTAASLHDRLARLGAVMLTETIGKIESDAASRTPQDDSLATYAPKITKEQGRIDWSRPAPEIERQVRAFSPWPSAYTECHGKVLKIWEAEVVEGSTGAPGEVCEGSVIATGRGGLRLLEVQSAGGKPMSFTEYLRGHPLEVGTILWPG